MTGLIVDRDLLPIPSRLYSLEILHAVSTLGRDSGVTFGRLGDNLNMSKPALSNTLKDLMHEGFVRKADDGLYYVTPDGRAFLERIEKESGFAAEVLRLITKRLGSHESKVSSMAAFIEQKIDADPRLNVPDEYRQLLRKYIVSKMEQLLSDVSLGKYRQRLVADAEVPKAN